MDMYYHDVILLSTVNDDLNGFLVIIRREDGTTRSAIVSMDELRSGPVALMGLLFELEQDSINEALVMDNIFEEASDSNGSFEVIVQEGSGSTSGTSSVSSALIGFIELEVFSARDLPPSRCRPSIGSPPSPFVVVSFGRKSFRTRTLTRTSDPVWREKLYLPVSEKETEYLLMFSLYNYRSIGGNNCIGKVIVSPQELFKHPEEKLKYALPIELTEISSGKFMFNGRFTPLSTARTMFWCLLCKSFDLDHDSDQLNMFEFETMMEVLAPDLSEEVLDQISGSLVEHAVAGEYAYRDIAAAVDFLIIKAENSEDGSSAVVQQCPVCHMNFGSTVSGDEIVLHAIICEERKESASERELTGGYLTEEHASRKWYNRLFSSFSFGGYAIGKNSGNILVHDRLSGKLIEEKMPAYIKLGIRIIYQRDGRAADLQMVRRMLHSMTLKQGEKFSSPASRKNIGPFIRFHGLNMEEVLDPLESFGTFNDFFYRKLKPGARPPASDDPNVCLCPADCRLTAFPTVDEATSLWIKGANFSIAELLKDQQLAEYFDGGSLAVCRLAPQDYHRFHAPFDASVNLLYHIPGAYFTVNPMAIRKPLDVFTENARTVVLLDSPVFGKVAYVAVGAMMVGSIIMTVDQGAELKALDEVGYFAFGGSTIVLVFPPGANHFDACLLANSSECLETLVRVGQILGRHP